MQDSARWGEYGGRGYSAQVGLKRHFQIKSTLQSEKSAMAGPNQQEPSHSRVQVPSLPALMCTKLLEA